MSSLRETLRSLTLGAPPRQMRKVLVSLRDSTQKRVLEVELDAEGLPKMEPQLDAKKKPVFDDQGFPVLRQVQRYRYPKLQLPDGQFAQVEVREPGLKQRAAIYRAAGIAPGAEAEGIDMAQLQVEAVVALTYEPGTNVKIYADTDKPALLAQLSGGFVDDIFEVASELMNQAKEEEVAKN